MAHTAAISPCQPHICFHFSSQVYFSAADAVECHAAGSDIWDDAGCDSYGVQPCWAWLDGAFILDL